MKVNYKKFSKHAEKMIKAAKLKSRPVLNGINHDKDGNLTVTDSHRLYHATNVNAPKDVILHAITGEEIDAGTYPDTERLIPLKDDASHVITFNDIKTFIKLMKSMQQAGMIDGAKKNEVHSSLINND